MGGSISVESTLGEGSTFTFKLTSPVCDWDRPAGVVVSLIYLSYSLDRRFLAVLTGTVSNDQTQKVQRHAATLKSELTAPRQGINGRKHNKLSNI